MQRAGGHKQVRGRRDEGRGGSKVEGEGGKSRWGSVEGAHPGADAAAGGTDQDTGVASAEGRGPQAGEGGESVTAR